MLSPAHRLGVWCLTGCVAVFSVFFHMFILLQSVSHARSTHHWTPCEVITSALALQSILQQALALLWMSLDLMDPQCILGQAHPLLVVLVLSLRFSVLWNTAFLLFYFATKLVMEPVHCYTRAQELVLRHVRPTVLLIPVCGLALCCPMLASMATRSHNATWVTECGSVLSVDVSGYTYVVLYLIICDVLPGVIMLKSSVSISVHLLLHLRHLKSSTNGFHGPKLGAEVRVIRMSLALAFTYLLFLAAELYTHYLILQQQNVLVIIVLLSSLSLAVCGLVLIYGKKSHWKELLHLYNLTLDRYPCLTCLEAPEKKPDTSGATSH
ncbi:uncharacterized protein LOC125294945 [Alosa alosa]|nr:uncharacterized protein LOC125294945 [Alosa alosa]